MQLEEEETTFHRGANSSRGAAGAPANTQEVEAPPQLPTDWKGYYACRRCRRVLVEAQWYREGCLGCRTGPIHRGELVDYATPHFTNFFGLIDPSRSWVARLIGKGGLLPDGSEVPNAIYAETIDDDDEEAIEEEEEAEEDVEDAEDAENVEGGKDTRTTDGGGNAEGSGRGANYEDLFDD